MNDYELSLQTEWDLLDMDDILDDRINKLSETMDYQMMMLYPSSKKLQIRFSAKNKFKYQADKIMIVIKKFKY